MRALCLFFSCLLCLSCSVSGQSEPNIYELERVIDGDTIELTSRERVRYLGLDCPERGDEPGFTKARERLVQLARGEVALQLVAAKRDAFGRILAYVHDQGKDTGLQLIKEGYCLHYTKYKHPRFEQYWEAQRDYRFRSEMP